ncbi:flavin reductase family protein [Streptomyces sp. NPDC102283]|uniref:flavin reductase family protein n=1 Tax=Streptomyces sp. NPDC102283 TaxID=3366155 RepID=UPI0038169DBC
MSSNRRNPSPLVDHPAAAAPLREVMSQFTTGVVVLTVGGEQIHGMTANAFSSVSLDPPSVLCCISHGAVMYNAITSARRFGVSIMRADQGPVARYFADKSRPLGPEQFDEVDWFPGGETGVPLLSGALAWLECEIADSYESGDHSIFIGDVLFSGLSPELGPGADRDGLLFFGGRFFDGMRRLPS